MLISLPAYKVWTLRLARISSLLFFYGIIASMAAANLGMALTLLFWIISGVWVGQFSIVKRSPVALPIVLLLLVTALSLSYAVAPIVYVDRYFLVYGKWLFVLVLISLHNDKKWLKYIFITVALAVSIVLLSTYANVFFDVPWANTSGGFGVDNAVFYDYIAQGVMSVCVSVVAWVLAFRSQHKWIRLVAGGVFGLLAFSVFFLLPTRTGQLAMVAAVFVASIFMFKKQQFFVFLVVFIGASAAALQFSPVLLSKIQLITQEAAAYMQGGVEMTSVGARLSMWENSLKFISDAPLFGHGVGGYRFLSETVYIDPVMCAISCVHPHNQLLFFMVEYGLAGFVIFFLFVRAFLMVAADWRGSNDIVFAIVVGFLTVFLVDSFINSPLWISSLRNFYIGAFAMVFIHYAVMRKES